MCGAYGVGEVGVNVNLIFLNLVRMRFHGFGQKGNFSGRMVQRKRGERRL